MEEVSGAIRRDIKNETYNKAEALKEFGNTGENRKYFLWGCALHTMTDALAHSTTKENGTLIIHKEDGTGADDPNYCPRRHKVATKIVQYSLENLKNGIPGSGQDVIKALNSVYNDQATFKIIRIKKYVNANGYNAPILDRATIANPS